jgi:small-conductance mechanosensitive channel
LRFLLTIAIGVGGTVAWQGYGDMAREMAAAAYPEQLGWLMPPPATTAPSPATATTVGSAGPAATSDQQQMAAISLNIAGVRQSVQELTAQLASSQQQIAQVASSHQQMADDIARLQASEQDILAKLSPPPRPPRPAPAHKPAPLALSPAAPPTTAH